MIALKQPSARMPAHAIRARVVTVQSLIVEPTTPRLLLDSPFVPREASMVAITHRLHAHHPLRGTRAACTRTTCTNPGPHTPQRKGTHNETRNTPQRSRGTIPDAMATQLGRIQTKRTPKRSRERVFRVRESCLGQRARYLVLRCSDLLVLMNLIRPMMPARKSRMISAKPPLLVLPLRVSSISSSR